MDHSLDFEKLQTEISIFENKITSCENCFGASDLEFWLGYLKSSTSLESSTKISSLGHLRTLLLKLHQESRTAKKHEKLFQYFVWFQKFVKYLGELRDMFLKQIMDPIHQVCTGKDIDDLDVMFMDMKEKGLKDLLTNGENGVGCFTSEEMDALKIIYEGSSVHSVLKQLNCTVAYWGVYLDEDTYFDLDLLSLEHAGKEKSRFISSDVLYLVNLVSAVMKHCKIAAKLAMQLITLLDSRTATMEMRMERLRDAQRILDERVSEMGNQIKVMEKELEQQSDLLQKFLQREERSNELNGKLYETDQVLIALKKQLEQIVWDRNVAAKNIAQSGRKKDATQVQKHRELCLKEVIIKHQIKATEYKAELLRKDLSLEMEVKPIFVRFTNNIQDQCQTLEAAISSKQLLRSQLLSLLTPITSSSQRVQRDIIRKSVIDIHEQPQVKVEDYELGSKGGESVLNTRTGRAVPNGVTFAKQKHSNNTLDKNRLQVPLDSNRYEDRNL